jgi:putative ABC transport system ATP-binding protein
MSISGIESSAASDGYDVTVLAARDLYKFYHTGDEETLALRGVSLAVSAGETIVIAGPSGSGKSTLVACIAGIDEPDGGTVTVFDVRMSRRAESERAALRARHIGILMQTGNLFEGLSVEDNVRLQAAIVRKPLSHGARRELLERVGLWDRRGATSEQLSGGEAARAGLAVALAAAPALLLADEPTGEVDAQTEARMLDLLDERRAKGGAAIIVTHSAVVAARADKVLHLVDGRIADG